MARLRLADLNGPKSGQNGPFWFILVSRMLNPVRNKVNGRLDHFGPKWPVWTPLLTPKIPPKKFMWVPFLRPFPGKNEAHQLFFWGPNGVFWVGPKKFMLKKLMCFFGPLNPPHRKQKNAESKKENTLRSADAHSSWFLSFFSLVFLFPWCFSSREFPWCS